MAETKKSPAGTRFISPTHYIRHETETRNLLVLWIQFPASEASGAAVYKLEDHVNLSGAVVDGYLTFGARGCSIQKVITHLRKRSGNGIQWNWAFMTLCFYMFSLSIFWFQIFPPFHYQEFGKLPARGFRQEFSSKAVKMATSTAMYVAPHHSSGMRPPWANNHKCHKVPPKKPSERYAPIKTYTNSKNS